MIRLGEARMNVLNFPVKDWIADTPTRAYMAFDAFVRAKKLAERARERYYAMRDRQTARPRGIIWSATSTGAGSPTSGSSR